MMFRTASGQKVAHEGTRTVECSTEYESTRQLGCSDIGAKDSVDCISSRRDRSSSAVHQDGRMHFE